MEISQLVAAISAYQAAYDRLPASPKAANSSDFTFGTFGTSDSSLGITNPAGYQANNSEVMAILMDLSTFPDGRPTVNADHTRNPQKTPFFAAKRTADTNSPGLGPDYVYRDGWGHPYIITINFTNTNHCRDAFYKLASVSENVTSAQGLIGLVRTTPPPYNSPEFRDSFELPDTVMIWSLGPDGKADKTQKANQGVNKDNVVSWQ